MSDPSRPYQIRGTLQTLLSLRVQTPEEPTFFEQLKNDVLRSPGFFKNAPVILDVEAILDRAPTDLRLFVAKVRASGLQPIALAGGDGPWNEAGKAVGLSIMAGGSTVPIGASAPEPATRAPEPPPAPPPPAAQPELRPTVARGVGSLLVDQPTRSGQQVFADGGDLVCVAAVSPGADVIATGHVHVYATLRGRAFAGFEGDERAMIFCDRLEAELVSIAGFHLVNDEIPREALGKRVRVRCASGRLEVEVVA